MAEKGVIIEFDFAAIDGAELLFETTKKFLDDLDGIPLDVRTESRYLLGESYLNGFTKLFSTVKTKKTAQKAARTLSEKFNAALSDLIPNSITVAMKNFVAALAGAGVKVVVATRADNPAVNGMIVETFDGAVEIFRETSPCYGSVKWDSWRRICMMQGMSRIDTLAIAGSGVSVKAALVAGMRSVAVARERVAYQDFTGADAVIGELSGKTAKKVLALLGMGSGK